MIRQYINEAIGQIEAGKGFDALPHLELALKALTSAPEAEDAEVEKSPDIKAMELALDAIHGWVGDPNHLAERVYLHENLTPAEKDLCDNLHTIEFILDERIRAATANKAGV